MNLLEAIATWLEGHGRLPFGAVKSCPVRQFWKPLACEDLDLGDRTAVGSARRPCVLNTVSVQDATLGCELWALKSGP